MKYILDNGNKRVAYANDFEDIIITMSPVEWQELVNFYKFRKKNNLCCFSKAMRSLLNKLLENEPKLKSCYIEITEEQMKE